MGNEASSSQDSNQPLPNDINLSWEKVVFENVEPRDGHCACACKNKLYIFGGVKHRKDDFYETNDFLVFDPVNRTCDILEAIGDVPVSRSSAVLACIDDKLYLFGGLSADMGWFNDLHVYNTTINTWKKIELSNGPSPRDKMACTVIGSNIYIFGGFGPYCKVQAENALNATRNGNGEDDDEEEDSDDEPLDDDDILDDESAKFGWFDDLYIYNTKSNIWIQPVQLNLACPSPRAALCMSTLSRRIAIFGGRDKHGRKKDFHIYDTDTKKWITNLSIVGKCPEARSFHTSVAIGDRMLICGGRSSDDEHFADAHIFDCETLQWLQPSTMPNSNYTNRGFHTMNLVGDYVVMFGGSGDFNKETMQCRTFYNDFYLLHKSDVLNGAAIPEISCDEDVHTDENAIKSGVTTETNENDKGTNDGDDNDGTTITNNMKSFATS